MLDRTRLMAVVRKETRQLRRDARSLVLAFVLPIVLLVFFGYAITWDVNDIRLAVVDQDHGARARTLVDAFRAAKRFRVVARPSRTAEIGPLLDRAAVGMVLVIPPDFSADLGAGRTAKLQVIVDGSDANTATISLGYTQALLQQYGADILLETRSLRLPVEMRPRVWFNEELSSSNMIVPGLVVLIMMIIAGLLTSLTIAREWEVGTMEQLASTPVTRLEVVLGKLAPFMLIGLVDVAVTSVVGVLLFHVPFRGNVLVLAGPTILFLAGTLGLGLAISAVSRTQLLATQIGMLATFLPGFLLSGFMYPIDNMPLPLRVLTFFVPARYFLVVVRGVFLKGVGPEVLWGQGVLMLLFAVATIALAVRAFRKELA
jgi:ABC-2 type transport system permease protein